MSLVEIYRSTKAACEHRAFVLRAVGIGSEIVSIEPFFALLVPAGAENSAREQLTLYERENAKPFVRTNSPPVRKDAWIAPTLYTFALLAAAFLAGRDFFAVDWYAKGSLSNAMQTQHEWWRAVTALTLHADHQHLLSNIGFGALFAFALARLVGSGITIFAIVVAGVFGNVLDALLMPANHLSIGASTMVFATLGLVAAYSWRIQFNGRMRWAHRWAPLVVGVMLLGFLGANGENTDVLAHLTGFFCGVGCGVLLARLKTQTLRNVLVQVTCGCAALMLLAGSWLAALI